MDLKKIHKNIQNAYFGKNNVKNIISLPPKNVHVHSINLPKVLLEKRSEVDPNNLPKVIEYISLLKFSSTTKV